jgi:hypothetical protein
VGSAVGVGAGFSAAEAFLFTFFCADDTAVNESRSPTQNAILVIFFIVKRVYPNANRQVSKMPGKRPRLAKGRILGL